MRNALATSIRRFASVETYPGITSETDVERILRVRTQVGVSQIERNEGAARRIAEKIFPSETVKAILNVSAPNTHLMLERLSGNRQCNTIKGLAGPASPCD